MQLICSAVQEQALRLVNALRTSGLTRIIFRRVEEAFFWSVVLGGVFVFSIIYDIQGILISLERFSPRFPLYNNLLPSLQADIVIYEINPRYQQILLKCALYLLYLVNSLFLEDYRSSYDRSALMPFA